MPTEAWNRTSVPLCTGVPPASMTVATTSADPLAPNVVELTETVTVDPVGASRATLSQAAAVNTRARSAETSGIRDTMVADKYNSCMELRQDNAGRDGASCTRVATSAATRWRRSWSG